MGAAAAHGLNPQPLTSAIPPPKPCQVTDTTTFSSERRRQQEDAWLYEICTRCLLVSGRRGAAPRHPRKQPALAAAMPGLAADCTWLGPVLSLVPPFPQRAPPPTHPRAHPAPHPPTPTPAQHLVDLTGTFLPAIRPSLPRLLDLLSGFAVRGHAALASVGVAALSRLVAATGPRMDVGTWEEVVGEVARVVEATLPDAAGLVTPPARGGSGGDLPSLQHQLSGGGGAGGVGGSSGGAGTPRPPYTLREGVGMRRLARFRVHSGVQLLLVQAMGEMYAEQRRHMPVGRGGDGPRVGRDFLKVGLCGRPERAPQAHVVRAQAGVLCSTLLKPATPILN